MMPSGLRPEHASGGTTTATSAGDAVVRDATPLSRGPQLKKLPGELVERPNWLPDDWKMEVRVRASGATAGTTDRYYISPLGNKLRSRNEVLYYLETGSKPNQKLKSKDRASGSGARSGQKQKKAKVNIRDLSSLGYDFKNPPQVVDYSITEEGHWIASVEHVAVSESERADWDAVFTRVIQLDRSNGTF